MGKEEKKESFLENLGRATMRGLRKCKKCGTLNGTRGFSCKNKSCDVIFKEPGGKKKSNESFKIITGNDVQIYSVRVRDKGPDFRAFVQLPDLPNEAKMMLEDGYNIDPATLLDAGAKCYVESCSKMNGYVMNATSVCTHLKTAALCFKSAQPLPFGSSVLNSLPICSDIKHRIYDLATSTTGPLVQRLSRQLFVVKCIPDSIHPLGFLHITFCQSKGKGKKEFYCSCQKSKCNSYSMTCIHLYACGLIFAYDEILAEEFSYYLNLIRTEKGTKVEIIDSDEDHGVIIQEVVTTTEEPDERSFLILNDIASGNPCQVEVEVVNNGNGTKFEPIHNTRSQTNINNKMQMQLKSESGIHLRTPDGGSISVHQVHDSISLAGLKRKQDDMQASCTLLSLQKSGCGGGNKRLQIEDSSQTNKKIVVKKESRDLEDDSCSLNFSSWLASVVERMNQTMHYGCSGKPDPLVFHLPKVFFSRLFERIHKCLRLKKGKISEETQNFERKEAVPLGEFTKHTWRLTSVSQVEKVFENYIIPLEVIKYFAQQPDGSYKNCSRIQSDPLSVSRCQEFKTVLRLSSTPVVVSAKDHHASLIIEWIPDILPLTQIGELRIRFEYDHYCNGQVTPAKPFILSPVNTPSKTPLKTNQPAIAPRPSNQKFTFTVPPSNNENVLSFPLPADPSISSGESITLLTF